MKYGLYSLPAGAVSQLEGLTLAKEMGLDAYEIFASLELETPDLEAAKVIRDRALELGVTIPCLSIYSDVCAGAEIIDTLKGYADVAAEMGIPYLHHTLAPFADKQTIDEVLDIVVPRVQIIYDYAEQKGVKCVYEDQGPKLNGVAGYGRFLESVGRDVGTVLDLGNTAYVGEKILPFAKAYYDRVKHIHIKDVRPNLTECDLGEGMTQLDETIRFMDSVGFSGWATLECVPNAKNVGKMTRLGK